MLVEPHLPSKIFQGITTEITGEGGSAAPLNDAIVKADKVNYDHLKLTPDWRNYAQYFARVEKQGLGINMAHFVGATQVRRMVLGDDDKQPTRGGARADEGAGPRGDGAGRGRRLDVAAVPAGALREDRGTDRARGRSREVRRHLRDAHAVRGRHRARGARRSDPDRPRGEDSGRDLARQGGGQAQLGPHERDRREDRTGAPRRRRHHRRHLRLPRLVQLVLRVHPAVGARRRRREAARAAEGSGRRARASGGTCCRPTTRAGTTSGRRSPAPRRC